MDAKAKSEATRKKILENREARLRFIKEGIPWRNTDDDKNNRSSNVLGNNEESDKSNATLPIGNAQSRLEPTIDNKEAIGEEVAEALLDNLSQIYSRVNKSNSLHSVESKHDRVEVQEAPSSENIVETERVSSSELPSLHSSNERVMKQWTDVQQSSEDPFKSLNTLLAESSKERRDQKQKMAQYSRSIWIYCVIMICLGIFVRISYDMGISWMFNKMMLVPFAVGATPLLVSLTMEPPPPSGSLVQLLIMSGVKVQIIHKAFNIFIVLRTFLQLFSVYLISFIFTHQIVKSFVQQ